MEKVSIITPVFNEEEVIDEYISRITKLVNQIKNQYEVEIIFTNNKSTDGSLDKLIKFKKENIVKTKIITFTRNFGYQAALICALKHSESDCYFFLDSDCEDPPELLIEFLKYRNESYKIIYGIRNNREGSKFINILRDFFYKIMVKISDNDFIIYMAEFSLIDNKVKEILISNNSTNPFLRTEIGYSGYKSKGINFRRAKRKSGKTKYNFFAMVKFAIGALLSTSTFPLRFNAYIAYLTLVINLFFIMINLIIKLNYYLIFLLNITLLILMIGNLSLYIARIYKDIIGRPLYIIDYDKSYLE